MKISSVAGIGVVLTVMASGSPDARPVRVIAPGAFRAVTMPARLQVRPRAAETAAPGCGTSTSPDFVGIAGVGDVAGPYAGVAAGGSNEACDYYDGIGGGQYNIIGGKNQAESSYVGAGSYNEILGTNGFIGAGYGNNVAGADAGVGTSMFGSISGNGSFIAAGDYLYGTQANTPTTPGNQISGTDSFIGAGDQNVLAGNEAFVGSGLANKIMSGGTYGAILGGFNNVVSSQYSEVLGGYGNTASGTYSMVLGGNSDVAAGTLSLAGGYHADAVNAGSFVWSDYVSGSTLAKDSAANQFVVRASGGTTIYSNEAMSAGVKLPAGSGAWASLSDRNVKTGVRVLDADSILAKVAALPIEGWSYVSERGVRHVGPMAQDFYAAFGVGGDDRHITSIDEDGVALASIKSLNAKLIRKNTEIADLRSRLAAVEARELTFERHVEETLARAR